MIAALILTAMIGATAQVADYPYRGEVSRVRVERIEQGLFIVRIIPDCPDMPQSKLCPGRTLGVNRKGLKFEAY